jgi:2-oxoglutarate ferredoxin oxidoreductase subunit delta
MAAKDRARVEKPSGKRPDAGAETAGEEQALPDGEERGQRFDVEIYRDWCKGCGICVAFCPQEVLSMNEMGEPEVLHPERCNGCAWCELRCPDFAISVRKKKETAEECEL